jgi:hypothetical protein
MLPIITVGLSPAALAVVERIPGDRSKAHYETAEEAIWELGTDTNPTVAQISLDDAGRRWSCHVLYGDGALGPLLTATALSTKPTRVPAQGLTGIVTDTLGSDPTQAYRVVDGQPEDRPQLPAMAGVEAVKLLRAGLLLVVDEVDQNPSWPDAVAKQLDNAEPGPGEPLGFVPGAEAKAELARAAELRSRGMARPGHFESRGQGRGY